MRSINEDSDEWNFAEFNDPGRLFHGREEESPEDRAKREEERKQRLREQLNLIYGVDSGRDLFHGYSFEGNTGKWFNTPEEAHEAWKALNPDAPEEAWKGAQAMYEADRRGEGARAQMAAEDKQVGDATRNYYTDELGRAFVKAERNTRFNLARSSLLGGSEDSFQQGDVRSDRDLGATRIDEATRRAVTGLHGAREDARLRGIGLINAGAGEEGVRSAAAGLKQSFDTALTAQKADLTGDLFANAIDGYTMQNNNAANRALLARYQQQIATSFPNSGSSSGRVTPTQ